MEKDNHSTIESSRFECLICSKTFLYRIGYVKHMQKHESKKTETETISTTTLDKDETNTEENSVADKAVIKNDMSKTSYFCGYCEKSFISSSKLMTHERIHSGEKPFQCQTCSRSFRELNCMKLHAKIHRKGKPYQCKNCNTFFEDLKSYQKHVEMSKTLCADEKIEEIKMIY